MKRLVSIFWISLLIALPGRAAPASGSSQLDALFEQGNASYQNGDFAGAEQLYRRLLDAGVDSGPLYYNLGNACFKQTKLGEAIYFWEKARRKMPGDSDVRENLRLANLMIIDRIDVPEDPLPVRLLKGAVGMFPVDLESRILLALFILANLLFGIHLLAKRPRLKYRALLGSLAAAALVVVFAGSLGWKIYEGRSRQEGVIVEQRVDVRSGPGEENITVVTVHEGIIVQVRGASGGWYQVSLPNGWNGWLPRDAVKVL